MPYGDGTGPNGTGPIGWGRGPCGRGMRGGRGRGFGQGMGPGWRGAAPVPEKEALADETRALKARLEELERRIGETKAEEK